MNHLLNRMRQIAQEATAEKSGSRLGVISDYDPNSYTATVKLLPEGTLTGWLPIKSVWVGNGWGLFAPPSVGDWCDVEFHDFDEKDGKVGLRYFNDEDRPLNVPSGEFVLQHQSGSTLHFDNTGKVTLSAAAELDVKAPVVNVTAETSATIQTQAATVNTTTLNVTATTIVSQGAWVHSGVLSVSGLLSANGGMVSASGASGQAAVFNGNIQQTGAFSNLGSIVSNGVNLSLHVHSGVEMGNGTTSPPTP